ncbi:AIPR family protein [Paenibacillus rubinfantis]|uniref:AIPR family protein n=1 Tax=Paenibacillus rubinfantis TaxID=1720296 RepID=UPI0009E9C3CF|nr:AIPR family protein [Paenibacillus rubinfantis]
MKFYHYSGTTLIQYSPTQYFLIIYSYHILEGSVTVTSTQLYLLNSIIDDYKNSGSFKSTDEAFEFFSAEQILKDKDIGPEEIESGLIGAARDGGVDGFFVFMNGEFVYDPDEIKSSNQPTLELHLMQFKNTNSVEELVLDRFIASSEHIFQLGINFSTLSEIYNPALIEKISLFHNTWMKVAGRHPKILVQYYHVCKGDKTKILGPDIQNDAYLRKMTLLSQKVKNTGGNIIEYSYNIVDSESLMELSRKNPTYSLPLKLNETPITIDYQQEQGGYIASTTLYEYYKFLSDSDGTLRKYLFESNVRDYQNNTDVNQEIGQTVTEKPEFDFWWLNNGVTIIAEKGTLAGKTLHLDNIQIVNGLQTSYTIFNALKNGSFEDDKRSVLLKIVITGKKETSDAIIKSTNSQNYVPPSTLRATDTIQRNIEEYLISKGFYYDRRKNFYKNQGKPRNKIISIKYLSQCLTSLVQKNPSKARSNPTTLTKNEKDYRRLFPVNRQPEIYLKSIEIMKQVERALRGMITTTSQEDSIATNYPFHVGRILVSILLNKADYNDREFAGIDTNEINDEKIRDAFSILKEILSDYQRSSSRQELINIAKNIAFSEHLTEELKKYFN